MRKPFFLIGIFIICSFILSFAGCAGKRDASRNTTTIEDDYKSNQDVSREMDRNRQEPGGY